MTRGLPAVLAVMCLSACGVGSESTFRAVSTSDVPFGLSDRVSTTAVAEPSTSVAAPGSTTSSPETTTPQFVETLYFVRDRRLVPVLRSAPEPATVARVVSDLVRGPTAKDGPSGMRTVVSADHVASVTTGGGVAVVDITADFVDKLPTNEQQLAVAQLVYTLTAQPGIGQVAFRRSAQPVDVPRSDGSLASGRVTRDDFPGALAP